LGVFALQLEMSAEWTFWRVMRWSAAAGTTIWLGHKFYDARGNLHKFEYLVVQSLKKLPLYPPPVSSPSVHGYDELRRIQERLPMELSEKFSEWFIGEDAKKKHGILRQDVIDFIHENTVLAIDETVLKEFLEKGRGNGPEQQRLSCCSLLGGFVFLRDVVKSNSIDNIQKSNRKLSGEDALDAIQLAVAEKERKLLMEKSNLSEAEQARLQDQLQQSESSQ
jgi:hypothetical protein